MKKFTIASLGIVAAIVAVVNVGSILALALSAAAAFFGWHYYRKSYTKTGKVLWGVVIVFGLLTGISNIPAFIGLLAAGGAYYAWRSWKMSNRDDIIPSANDPFMKFEKQWREFTK